MVVCATGLLIALLLLHHRRFRWRSARPEATDRFSLLRMDEEGERKSERQRKYTYLFVWTETPNQDFCLNALDRGNRQIKSKQIKSPAIERTTYLTILISRGGHFSLMREERATNGRVDQLNNNLVGVTIMVVVRGD